MNEKWYSLSISEAEKILNTNVSSGLDPKEAERRRRRGEGGSVYSPVGQSVLAHASKAASDITVIMFALAALISAFLDDGKRAGLAFVLSLVALGAAVVGYVLSRREFESGAELSIPRSRVIRGGRVYLIDSENVVQGDVLLLGKGDVVPADCRLISSSDMRAVEFVGKFSGKEKRELNEKDAAFVCRPEDKPNVSAQKNMLVASSVIVSGSGRAVAVRTGKRTFLSLLVGEIDIIPKKKKDMKILTDFSKILGKINLALLIAIVPFAAIVMITGKNELGILDVLLSMLALAVTSGSGIIGGLTYIFPALTMHSDYVGEYGARIKYPDAIQELNYIDSVLVVGNKALCDNTKHVESVFASNRFYDSETAKKGGNQALNCFLDLAVLGTSHYLNSSVGSAFSGSESAILGAKAIANFASECGIDRSDLEEKYLQIEFSPAGVSGYDTTLIKSGEEYRIICASESSELLGLCDYIRTPDGAVALDDDKKSDIIRACSQLVKKAKSVTLIASRISPISRLERLGLVQNRLIFEGYILYSDPYEETLGERIAEMKEADITFYYASEENSESVITAFNIGAVKGKHEIAYASAFRRAGKKITDGIGNYRAYLGFGEKELCKLAQAIRGDDGTLAVIASETDHLALLNCANIAVAVTDSHSERTSIDTFCECSEIIRKNADVLVPFAKKAYGGFEAFYRTVIASKRMCAGLCGFVRYLAFSASLRLILALIPLFFGKMLLSAVQIIFLGTLTDIPAIICFALSKRTSSLTDNIEDIETMLLSPLKKLLKYLVSGASLGLVMLLFAAVFGSMGSVQSEQLSVFAFAGALLTQLFAIVIISKPSNNDRTVKAIICVLSVIIAAILVLSLCFKGFGELLGVAYPGWQICSAALLISVIGYVILLVTDRYI